jgi:hypothetical protein
MFFSSDSERSFLRRHSFLRRAILLLVAFCCFRAAELELRATRQYKEVAKWPTAQALITSSSTYLAKYSWSLKGRGRCPKLGYNYTAQGRTYDGFNLVFDFVCWPDANDFVAQHQPGTLIKIAYDPATPAVSIIPDAVRDPGYPWGDIVGGVIFAAILFMDLFRGMDP